MADPVLVEMITKMHQDINANFKHIKQQVSALETEVGTLRGDMEAFRGVVEELREETAEIRQALLGHRGESCCCWYPCALLNIR